VSLKFATTLKNLPCGAKNLEAELRDFENNFLFAIEWKEGDKVQSYLLRSNEDVFNYTELKFEGKLIGFGARKVEYGPGYKIFAATSNGFYEELDATKYGNFRSLVRNSVRASAYRQSQRHSSLSGVEKLTNQTQEDLISTNFDLYYKNPQDNGVCAVIRKQISNYNIPTLQPFLVSLTFKIVEDTSRNLILATKSANEDLTRVMDVKKLDQKFQDMITVELNKKQSRLNSWKEYLEQSGLLHILDDENRSKIVEAS